MTPARRHIAAGYLAAVLAATGCSGSHAAKDPAATGAPAPSSLASQLIHPPAASPATSPAGGPARPGPARPVNTANPAAVAMAAVTAMNQTDTATDLSPLDAVRRAGRWLTPELLAGSLDTPQRGNAAWSALAGHRGYTTAEHLELANESGQPASTSTTAFIQISYRISSLGRDGWRGPSSGPQLARLELTWQPAAAHWLVCRFGAQ